MYRIDPLKLMENQLCIWQMLYYGVQCFVTCNVSRCAQRKTDRPEKVKLGTGSV